jgi:hypothetical protein
MRSVALCFLKNRPDRELAERPILPGQSALRCWNSGARWNCPGIALAAVLVR